MKPNPVSTNRGSAALGDGGDPAPGFATLEQTIIQPVSADASPAATRHVNATGMPFDTIHPVDARYFDDLAAMIAAEHADAVDPEVSAELAQLGIDKKSPMRRTSGCATSSTKPPRSGR